MSAKSADEAEYVVLVNHEEQYSLWPARRPIPDGWRVEGSPASKETCLSYIGRSLDGHATEIPAASARAPGC